MQNKICLNCKTEYPKNKKMSNLQWANSKFCSRKCFGVFNGPRQFKRFQDPVNHPRWKGGKGISTHGYIESYSLNSQWTCKNRNYEHRQVMGNYLGRKLTYNEIIHHKNHNKLDNRIENLEIMPRSEHIKIHNWHERNDWKELEFKRMINQRKTKLDLTLLRIITQTGYLAHLEK